LHDTSTKTCEFRHTARSQKCDSPLFDSKGLPLKQYSTQNLEQWLERFLKRDGIETLLEKSVNYLNPKQDAGILDCLWDGSCWSNSSILLITPCKSPIPTSKHFLCRHNPWSIRTHCPSDE
ncbi:uncharacterized protein VP01_8518g1, partial [Puccinia sorghi]